MSTLDHRLPQSPITDGNPARRGAVSRSRGARIQRVFDGVVASYIRDISVRRAPQGPAASSAGCTSN